MLSIKKLVWTFVMACCLTLPTWAADTDEIDIRANFANFWSAMGSADYRGAFAFVHPLDLAQLRTQVLPVFLQAGSSEDDEVQQLVGMFFDGVPKERRSQLSGPEVFVQLQRMLQTAQPALIDLLAQFKPEILEIKRDAPNEATVR